MDPLNTPVRDIITDPVRTVAPDLSVREAVERMDRDGLCRLPVTSADGVVGIVTTTDLVDALTTETETVVGVLARSRTPDPPPPTSAWTVDTA